MQMDGQNRMDSIPKLPPPEETPPEEPYLHAPTARRLRRAYRVWCVTTLCAALCALALLGAQGVAELREGGDGYLRRQLLTRVMGIGEEAKDDSLLELMLGQTLYARGTARTSVDVPPETTAPAALTQPEPDIPTVVEPEPKPLDLYAYDPSLIPEGEQPILPLDLSLSEYGSLYISNETAYSPNLAALLEKKDILPAYSYTSAAIYPPGDPLVLILHTHGTEAYSPDGAISYVDNGDYARSSNPEENVVAVGERMTEILCSEGIPTLHCVILHDKNSYRDSYVRAAETINAYLAEYPSIQYVFDIHRDALIRGEGDLVRPVVEVNGEATAQVMILAGSDYKGANFPDWEDNLAFALQLRETLNSDYPRLARPVYLRGAGL